MRRYLRGLISRIEKSRIFIFVKQISHRISEHNVPVYSARAAFFMIISALPLLMLVLGFLKYILPDIRAEVFFTDKVFLPEQVTVLFNRAVSELYELKTAPVISTAAAGVLWAASKGILSLLDGLDNIYGIENKRGYVKSRIVSVIYTAVFTLIITLTLVLFVAGKYIAKISYDKLYYAKLAAELFLKFPALVYFAVLTVLFAAVYKYLPGRHLPFKSQLPGAVISSGGWILFSVIYSFYIDNFANYSYIYGSLTAIVLLMLWLYFCMNIFLFGAELNEYLHWRREGT